MNLARAENKLRMIREEHCANVRNANIDKAFHGPMAYVVGLYDETHGREGRARILAQSVRNIRITDAIPGSR